MNFSHFSIRAKIGFGFGTLVVIIVLLGLAALWQLQAVNASTAQITADNLANVQLAATMRDLLGDIRRAEARHVLADSRAVQDAQEERIAQGRKQLEALEPTFTRAFRSPQELSALNALRSNREAWFSDWEKLRNASRQGSAGSDQARSIYSGASSQAFTTAFAAAQQLGDINTKLASQAWENAQGIYNAARLLICGVIAFAIVLASALAWFIARAIADPIGRAAQAARHMAAGDMRDALQVHGTNETAQLLQALDGMRTALSGVVAKVRTGAETVASVSAEIAEGNHDLSGRTEHQASALEQTASSMEQLSATVRQNAEAARQANQLATSASTVAISGGQVVGEVVQTMKGINESSRRISDIISVIDGIAFQTNILALNAAVEAARAGEQGRGFAVVASEVRLLAGRSAEAAREIKSLINASVERVEQGTLLVDKAGTTMSEVVSSIRRVADIMGEINAASSEQAAGFVQIGEAVGSMDQVTQQNAAMVEQVASAARGLQTQALALVEMVATFRLAEPPVEATPLPRTSVRSPANAGVPYRQKERRAVRPAGSGAHAAQAARPARPRTADRPGAPAGSRATTPPSSPAANRPPPGAAARGASRSSAQGDDGEWETF